MQVTRRAQLEDGVLEELINFNRKKVYYKPVAGQLETALEWLTTPKEIASGLGYITLGRFEIGQGNVLDAETGLLGKVVMDFETPDGLYRTELTRI